MGAQQQTGTGNEAGPSKTALQAHLWRMRAEVERVVAEAGPGRMAEPGAMGDWTLKDAIAHLAAWRWWSSVAQLEAALRDEEPILPWPADLDEGRPEDVARINRRFHEAGRARPLCEVLRDSRDAFDRLEAALLAFPDENLHVPGRYPWLGDLPAAALVGGPHLYDDHLPELDAFLARAAPTGDDEGRHLSASGAEAGETNRERSDRMSTTHEDRRQGLGDSSNVGLQGTLWRMRADLERIVATAGPGRMDEPGAMGDWTLKDVIAHLTAWRWWSVARLEGATRGEEPTPPWDPALSEERDDDTDRINQGFYEAARDQSVAEVLRDSRATLDRLEAAVLALPEADLLTPGRYPWLADYPLAAVITGSAEHLREHDEELAAFLGRNGGRGNG